MDFNSANRRYHFPFRFYLPFRGAFGQADPLIHIGESTKYMVALAKVIYPYGLLQPTVKVDPAGLWGTVLWEPSCKDPLCPKGSPRAGYTQADLAKAFYAACHRIEAFLKYLLLGLTYNGTVSAIKDWQKKMSADEKSKLINILKKSHKQCVHGIVFDCCTSCDKASVFETPHRWLIKKDSDCSICYPTFCNQTTDRILEALTHEITHYGGASDTDADTTNPNDWEGFVSAITSTYDDFADKNPTDPIVKQPFF